MSFDLPQTWKGLLVATLREFGRLCCLESLVGGSMFVRIANSCLSDVVYRRDCNTIEAKFGRIWRYDLWKEICKVAL
jgi:hypothetical protein